MSEEKGVVQFGRQELDPAAEQKYRNQVRQAKGGVSALKGQEPVGGVPRPQGVPVFRQQRTQQVEDPMEAMAQKQGAAPAGVQPRGPGVPVIRAETARQLEEAAQAAANQKEEPKAPEAKPEDDDDVDPFGSFDFVGKDEAQRILDNKKRRKAIEARCSKMDFRDLLERDEVRQTVPIRPDDFVVVFRSMTPAESLFVKQYMAKEENRTEMYLLEKYGLCQLACGLVSLNEFTYPPHLNKDSEVDKEVFEKKLKQLTRKSGYIIADLALNYHWFDLRVRRLINVDEVGNG